MADGLGVDMPRGMLRGITGRFGAFNVGRMTQGYFADNWGCAW